MANLDKISSLPDTVLCHILSFLRTKVAVRTSVLSKSWRSLWLSVPTLDFDLNCLTALTCNDDPFGSLIHMVYAVMLKKDVTHTVKKFLLNSCSNNNVTSSDVNTWVRVAIERRVEHLELSVRPFKFNVPSCMFGSTTLVVLKLSNLTFNDDVSIGFPSLKIMHLEYVRFTEHLYLIQLLSGCPVLEDLNVRLPCILQRLLPCADIQTLHKLVRADIFISQYYISSLKWMCEVKFLTLTIKQRYSNYKLNCTFHNLTHLKLMVAPYNWGSFIQVLKHSPKLQVFEIVKYEDKLCDPQDENWIQPGLVLPECFSSQLRSCSFTSYQGCEHELQFAKYIMQNAKVLCTMRIYSDSSAEPLSKLKMLKELSLFPRMCELSFE